MKPTVAIVILNWNGQQYLQQFLPYVLASDYPDFEVIVADNASADGSVAFLKEHFPAVRVIQLPENYGFARGYNKALAQVEATYYVLLNSDVEVTPGWLSPIINLMDSAPDIAACQPKILMYNNKTSFEYAGAAGGWLDFLGYPFARGRVFDFCEEDKGQYDTVEPIFWASGAALFVRSDVYHKVGGLEEYFFAHQEEIDLCWRIQLAGYRIMACPQSVVYHIGGGTLPKGNERKVLLNFRNNLIMLAKNLPLHKGIVIVFVRFALDAISAWKSLLEGQAIYFKAILEAHIGFLKWLIFHRKRSIYPASKKGYLRGMLSKSIVWLHFVKGKKRFSEIISRKG